MKDTTHQSITDNITLNEIFNNAFVLLGCERRMMESVIEQIKSIPIVSDVKPVEGFYDIVVRLEAESHHTINQEIEKIRLIDGIKTCIILQGIRSYNFVQKLYR